MWTFTTQIPYLDLNAIYEIFCKYLRVIQPCYNVTTLVLPLKARPWWGRHYGNKIWFITIMILWDYLMLSIVMWHITAPLYGFDTSTPIVFVKTPCSHVAIESDIEFTWWNKNVGVSAGELVMCVVIKNLEGNQPHDYISHEIMAFRQCWPVTCCLVIYILTHWGLDKIAAILPTTFSNAFSWMKMHTFRFSLFLRFELTIFQHWFRQWLGADQATMPLSEPMMVTLLMHICVTRPQWMN